MVEVEVYENSRFEELASNALRKLGLRENEHNVRLMMKEIQNKVEAYIRQFSRKVKHF